MLTVALAGVLAALGGNTPAFAKEATLPAARDLREDARGRGNHPRLVVVLFSLPDCSYCDQIRREQLIPLARDRTWTGRLVVREVSIVGARTLIDFRGARTNESAFARAAQAKFSPTVAFFDPAGEQVAPAIVGARLPDFYGAYLSDAIDSGLSKIEKHA